jgi:uncharacterized protein (DUF342 family)/DNA-binding response OmpR family regulator
MLEKKQPKVILLENNEAILQSANTILSQQGWNVTCEQTTKEALKTLKESKDGPFALFITNFKLPKMEGDDILEQVKKISPITQRMLMISTEEPDILISAINKAEINACIAAPFKEEDLIAQTRNCFRQFKQEVKRRRLKRVTVHQNKQMFKVAQKLKKKDGVFQKKIEEKRNTLLKLKSKKRALEGEKRLESHISVEALLDHKEISPTPELLSQQFTEACKGVKSIFDAWCSKNKLPTADLDFDAVFTDQPVGSKTPETEETPPSEGNAPQTALKDDAAAGSEQAAPDTEQPAADHQVHEAIIQFALTGMIDKKESQALSPKPEPPGSEPANPLENYLELRITEDQTQAFLKRKPEYDVSLAPSVSRVLDWLSERMVSYGILEDAEVDAWLKKSKVEEIIIARGEDPFFGTPGIITYHFESDFTNPGKINEDGSIDFRDRGNIPFVEAGTLLAKKVQPKQGHAGISVTGIPIPVAEVDDPVLAAGSGVRLSEDGLSIHADIDGQPHVDAMGNVSVSPELVIQGDVDYETGNIDFKGNIIVKGIIKDGFTVKGTNLTVQEIDGAIIDLSGDLQVSAGINDATVWAQGNIYAKFINNSKIMGFADLSISKEIIDSNVLLSGGCQNSGGHIISSQITAKLGIEAGKIGTSASKPSHLKVGVNDHIETITAQVDDALEISLNKSNLLKDDIKKLEDEDQALYEQISQKAHIQDRSQIEIKQINALLPDIEKSQDMVKLARAADEIKALKLKAEQAEKELNRIFETQDMIARRIEQIKAQLTVLEEKNKTYVLKKRALKDFSKKQPPQACITVAKTIAQDTIIKGPHSSIVVKEDSSRCKIQELESSDEGIQYFSMVFSDLT